MKLRNNFRLRVSNVVSLVESLARGGRVQVLAINCRSCQRMVKPEDWNPHLRRCEVCAGYEVRRMRAVAGLREVA